MSHANTSAAPSRLAHTPDDYARFGIEPRAIKPWEDGPLVASSVAGLADWLRTWSPRFPLASAIREDEESSQGLPNLESTLAVVRLAATEPVIRDVWLQAAYFSRAVIAEIFAEHAAMPADSPEVQVWAGMVGTAMFTAIKRYAATTSSSQGYEQSRLVKLLRRSLDVATAGVPTASWAR